MLLIIRTLFRAVMYKLRWPYSRVKISPYAWVSIRAKITCQRGANIIIGDYCEIHPNTMIISHGGNISIGPESSLNPYSVIYGAGDVIIGKGVGIATGSTIVPVNHNTGTDVLPFKKAGLTMRGIVIEDSVWLGAGTRVLDGVKIGRNSVVAAGSVVLKDIGSNCIVGGVPARFIRNL